MLTQTTNHASSINPMTNFFTSIDLSVWNAIISCKIELARYKNMTGPILTYTLTIPLPWKAGAYLHPKSCQEGTDPCWWWALEPKGNSNAWLQILTTTSSAPQSVLLCSSHLNCTDLHYQPVWEQSAFHQWVWEKLDSEAPPPEKRKNQSKSLQRYNKRLTSQKILA